MNLNLLKKVHQLYNKMLYKKLWTVFLFLKNIFWAILFNKNDFFGLFYFIKKFGLF